MTPSQRYQQDISSGGLLPDTAQAEAIVHVQRLYDELLARHGNGRPAAGLLARLMSRRHRLPPPRGLYFHGGVGRGKTYIMDTFHECLPLERKLRTHFHRFMQKVHAELSTLRQQKNPLVQVADRIAEQAVVICFDEFFVSDIGDAMILGGLLELLTERGVVLVATSNIHPDRLYENGLQRDRFLPAIKLLHAHTDIVELDGGVDYRLRVLRQAAIYFTPLGPAAETELARSFNRLSPEHAAQRADCNLEVLGRKIAARRVADDVVWFDFDQLCGGPRSAYDYIELGREFQAVLVSNVPQLDASRDDAARRFVSMVDEFYDRSVKLIISAAVPLQSLYTGRELAFVFERTTSRLLEMQSEDYLGRQHKA